MCGIAGFCDFTRDNRGTEWQLAGWKMANSMARRGPDDEGEWYDKNCLLAHRRLAVIDPEQEWTVAAEKFYTKGSHSPFVGRKLKGKAVLTIVDGRIVMRDGQVIE